MTIQNQGIDTQVISKYTVVFFFTHSISNKVLFSRLNLTVCPFHDGWNGFRQIGRRALYADESNAVPELFPPRDWEAQCHSRHTDQNIRRCKKFSLFCNFQVGYPIRGGLYDPLMGPFERDRCETCNQYDIHCPGHLGHIELDVPVFNPVLFQFTLSVRNFQAL